MKKILVIGASGLVGRTLVSEWKKRGASVTATHNANPAEDSIALDIRRSEDVSRLFNDLQPSVVALPAANPFVDYCELNPEETRAVNVDGTKNVAQASRAVGARLIFFSSDYVFDGNKGGDYVENDPVGPLNEYGRQKLAGEQAVMTASASNLVLRISAVYGWQEAPKNFVLQVLTRLSQGLEVKAATDVSYNPTSAANLADVCAVVAEKSAGGIFHVCGPETISRFDFARRIAEIFGLDGSSITAVSAAEFKQPAPRPRLSSMDTAKVRLETGCELWRVARGLEQMKRSQPSGVPSL